MRTPSSARRALPLSAVLLVSTMALASCGNAGQGAETPGGLIPLKVSVAGIQFEPAYLAESQGFFEDHGLDVEIINGADPAAQIASAISGEVDIATGSWVNVATSVSKGLPIEALASNGVVDPNVDNSGVLVAKDSGIARLADLKGKTIGVIGVKTGSDLPVFQALEDAGVGADEFSEVGMPYAGMQAAVETGTVDAVVPSDVFYHQMVAAGFPSLGNPVREYQGNQPGTLWLSTSQWSGANPDTAKAFVSAMKEAVEFYSDAANLEEVQKIHAEVNQIPVEKAPTRFALAGTAFDAEASQSGLDAMARFELIDKPVTVDEVLWEHASRK
ncbi:ABC transporter substrate-binding protein [Glutamicibacter sp. NPDC127525]|uniref:ABC transporter substrate-binding protein n=1 Tax=unclassified Glutamicibacter TaxID=2627139 RepID=UPI00362EB5F6